MGNEGAWRLMSTSARSASSRILPKVALVALCVLCLRALCGCAGNKPGDEGAVERAIRYATSRANLDLASSSAINRLPDAAIEISLMGVEDVPGGAKEIVLEPSVISDTMASWDADRWAKDRDDLFFNLVAHFKVICKQADKYGNVPEGYSLTCPDYMVVYDSQRSKGFVVTATGVYHKTDDPDNPIGEAIVRVTEQ